MTTKVWTRTIGYTLSVACLLLFAGCRKQDTSCSITGQVLVNGRQAEGVYVVFHANSDPPTQQSLASARTTKGGAFSLRVPAPGDYAVTVFWPQVTVEADEAIEGRDYLGGRFKDPRRPAQRVTVRERDNRLPAFELKVDFNKP